MLQLNIWSSVNTFEIIQSPLHPPPPQKKNKTKKKKKKQENKTKQKTTSFLFI